MDADPAAALAREYRGAGDSGRDDRLRRRRVVGLDPASLRASHIVFSYGNHVAYAYLPDAYPRYYLPLAAMVPLAGLSLARSLERPALRDALMTFLVLGPIAFALTGVPLGA